MTQLDLRRRIVRYLIECDEPINTAEIAYVTRLPIDSVTPTLRELLRDGMAVLTFHKIAIRNLSDAEQWLIDTMPRTPAEQE